MCGGPVGPAAEVAAAVGDGPVEPATEMAAAVGDNW